MKRLKELIMFTCITILMVLCNSVWVKAETKNIGTATTYNVDKDTNVGTAKRKHYFQITTGNIYIYEQEPQITGKAYVGRNVTITLTYTNSEGNTVKTNIKKDLFKPVWVDLQKLLYKVTDSNVKNIKVEFGGNGIVKLYGPYRIYSNTTLVANKNITFKKPQKGPDKVADSILFLNTDDASSKNYLSSLTTWTQEDSYRAAKNIVFNGFCFDLSTAGHINVIKMIHASNIKIMNCSFEVEKMTDFNAHIIECTAVKDLYIYNCKFNAAKNEVITDKMMDDKYYNTELVQVEAARWSSNPVCKFPDAFYTTGKLESSKKLPESYDSQAWNQSKDVIIEKCSFTNVPNCMGNHIGGKNRAYSSDIWIMDCNFVNVNLAIHLRGLVRVRIMECYLNGKLMSVCSKYVRYTNKLYDDEGNLDKNFTPPYSVVFGARIS